MKLPLFVSVLGLTAAAPAPAPAPVPAAQPDSVELVPRAAPSIVIKNGTVVGSTSSGIDSFKGIPFAQPPVGNLRLRPPQTINATFGTIAATGTPNACPQLFFSIDDGSVPTEALGYLLDSPLVQAVTSASEDCLTINVVRPAGIAATAKLPVLFWIFGGGFELGSTQMYDGSNIVAKSVSLGQPVIFVAVNYRVGAYGFMGGDDLTKEGSTNLGLRDQRKGLEWIQENIAAFGGDPTKVTIWGESAGAISVFDHLIINNGDNTYNGKALFRGAIMNSGTAVPAGTTTSAKAQAVYNKVVSTGGCSSASDKLACLRALSYDKFLAAANSNPGIFSYSSLNLAYLPRPDPSNKFFSTSPEVAIANGIAKVPIIVGDQEDEGTLFSLVTSNVTTDAERINYFQSYFPSATRQQITDLFALYPDDITAGSPFETGILNEIYSGFKKTAAIIGDVTFTLSRRSTLAALEKQGFTSWSYLSTFFYGLPVLGTFHGSDLLEIFFGIPYPLPTTTFLTYYISFTNSLDPNSISTASPLIQWPKWTNASRQLLKIGASSNTLTTDTFRDEVVQYLAANSSNFRV